MRGTFPLIFLNRKVLDNKGEPLTFRDGRPVEQVSAFDVDTDSTIAMTIDPDLKGKLPEAAGQPFTGTVRIIREQRDGATKTKFRLLAVA